MFTGFYWLDIPHAPPPAWPISRISRHVLVIQFPFTHPLSHLSHPSGLPETLPVSFIWLLLLDVCFGCFFPSFLHSSALVSLPLRLLLLPLHKTCRGVFLCSSNWSVLVGPQSSLLLSLILLQAVYSEEYNNNSNRTEKKILSFSFFWGVFFGF